VLPVQTYADVPYNVDEPHVAAAADKVDAALYNKDITNFVSWLKDSAIEQSIPGVAMAIVTHDSVLLEETWGLKDIKDTAGIDEQSVFRIASMSKTFAGTATALLVEHHLQSWDTLLTDVFPALNLGTRGASKGIQLKHIVSHSTGLMPHSFSNMLDDGVGYEKIKPKFKQIPTVCAPGDCYGYQNVVFSLTAEVVESSTGSSYAEYLEEELFKPLGMTGASVGIEPYNNNPEATKPHRYSRGRWQTTSTNAAYYTVAPASGVNASIKDMELWLRANLGGFPEVLSPEFLGSVHEPIIATPRGNYFNRWRGLEKAYYATGWRVFDYRGLRAIHHGGGVRGYRSEMVFVPAADIGLVVLFNAESKLANDIVPAFLDNLIDVSAAPH
jgi:beta-lactamase class C